MSDRKILYATDYSGASRHALGYACSLAHDLDALLFIAHVSEYELYPVGEPCGELPDSNPGEMQRLKSVLPDIRGIRFEHRLLYAPPTSQNISVADELIRFADAEDIYAIVVGTHGRSGLTRALMGSTAENLIRLANCPVVTVRCPGRLERRNEPHLGGLQNGVRTS